MKSYKYIIIGGGMAGGNAAKSIRELDSENPLALITQESHLPYQRPPLSKGYLQGKATLDKVYLEDADFYKQRNIEVLTTSRVAAINPEKHTIALQTGQQFAYEKLLLATGGSAKRLPLPGINLQNVFTLRTIEESEHIRRVATSGKKALVLGGSFIGAEVAASLCNMGVSVTMVFPESRLLEKVVPEELSQFLHEKYADRGINIRPGMTPEKLEGDTAAKRVHLSNGEILPVDLVVLGVGINLNTQLAKEAGLTLDGAGAVIVDEMLRTSDPDIYAAGDIAAWPDPTFEKRLRVEHWDVARGQGVQAGRNMAGEAEAYNALPYFFSDLFDFSFEAWGDFTSWDQTVLQGALRSGSFTFTYFQNAQVVAILSVNPSEELRNRIPEIIRARESLAEITSKLQKD